jgi:hypothetical protein
LISESSGEINIESSVYKRDYSASVIDTCNDFALSEAELLSEGLIPQTSSLLLTVQVLLKIEDVIFSVAIDVESSRNCHIEVALDVCLTVCEDKVKLTGVPAIDKGDDQEDSDQNILNNRGISLPEVDAHLLLSSVDSEWFFHL